MATAWTRAPPVLAAISAEGRYPDSTRRRSKDRERRTVANTTNPVMRVIELIRRYQTGTKATSRIQANRFRTCAARLSLMAVSSCWRMAARLLLNPPAGQMADPVEPLLLEDQMANDHR